jgi:pyrimidine-nucleoside phosphorylase
MRAADIIRNKREGRALQPAEIDYFVQGVTDGSFPDYQASALLMAIFLRGMTGEETAHLTDAMVRSGARMTYPDVPGVPVDKHSTGGVGDKASLILAPLAVACGAAVPMMSGRGLGHTGGTLDKLESIPGFVTSLSLGELRTAMANVRCALIGQTSDIAPADRRLYALRDVTATVESIPLISASIMSKKIAEGIGGLVLDVKTGAGAFMKTVEDSRRLAESLVTIGNASGVRTEALITAMDAPLGRAVGNANEVIESIETLKGKGPEDLETLSVELAARMLVLAGIAASETDGVAAARKAVTSGSGLEAFKRIVENQHGNPRIVDDYSLLPSAPDRHSIPAPRAGYVHELRAEHIGRAAVALGAGRARLEDTVDHGVGIEIVAPVGTHVRHGDTILILHHRSGHGLHAALPLVNGAIAISDAAPAANSLILDTVRGGART